MTVDADEVRATILRTLGWLTPPDERSRLHVEAAFQLVDKLKATWSGGPTASVWAEVLANLDMGRAGTAFARLRLTEDRAPAVARFMREYRTLDTTIPDAVAETCDLCDGSGWVDAEPLVLQVKGEPYEYSQVRPCGSCAAGDHARRVHQRIAQVNGWKP